MRSIRLRLYFFIRFRRVIRIFFNLYVNFWPCLLQFRLFLIIYFSLILSRDIILHFTWDLRYSSFHYRSYSFRWSIIFSWLFQFFRLSLRFVRRIFTCAYWMIKFRSPKRTVLVRDFLIKTIFSKSLPSVLLRSTDSDPTRSLSYAITKMLI